MSLKDFRKEHPDAMKSELTVTTELLHRNNFYTGNGLREYIRKLFPGSYVLDCRIVGKKITAITSEKAFAEEERQLSMNPGTKVKMQERSGEVKISPEKYKDREFIVVHGPQWMCGNWVVWLEGFSGAYSCELLDIIESSN